MTNFDHEDLPPDLSELGRRMRDERPAADDDALDRMRQRAQASPRGRSRAPRRAFAASLAAMVAMLSVTAVAAAAFFGVTFTSIGSGLTNSTKKVGAASSQTLRAPAASSKARLPATIGSAVGALGGIRPIGGAAAPAAAAPAATSLIPNAGNFQYGPGRLVCRILRALGLGRIARLLGC